MRSKALSVLILGLSFLLVSSKTFAESRAPYDQALKRVRPHIKHIEARTKDMEKLYKLPASKETLGEAFKKHGVRGKAMMYTDSWGGWLYMDWDSASGFYHYHYNALLTSSDAFMTQGFARESELTYLDKGMAAWKADEKKLETLFQDLTDLYGKKGFLHDQKLDAEDSMFKIRDKYLKQALADGKDYSKQEKAELQPLEEKKSALEKQIGETEEVMKTVVKAIQEIGQKRHFKPLKPLDSRDCEEGAVRESKPTQKTWKLPDPDGEIRIQVVAAVKRGEYAVPGSEEFLSDIADALYIAGKIVTRIPGGAILKIPTKYLEKVAKAGGEITKAGKRFAERAGRELVDISIRIPTIERTVECAKTDECKNGKWIAGKIKPRGEPKDLPGSMVEKRENVTGTDAERIINAMVSMHQRALSEAEKSYGNDPCQGAR